MHTYLYAEFSWSYSSWIYNYLCNHCLLPLKLWVQNPFVARCTRYNIMWSNLSVTWTGRWCSPGTPFSTTNKTDCHDITEISLKVALNTISRHQTIKFDCAKYACTHLFCSSQYMYILIHFQNYISRSTTLYTCIFFW